MLSWAGRERIPETEFASLELARAVGFDVPEARLVEVAAIAGLPNWATETGGHALLVRRFDRVDEGRRVHGVESAVELVVNGVLSNIV